MVEEAKEIFSLFDKVKIFDWDSGKKISRTGTAPSQPRSWAQPWERWEHFQRSPFQSFFPVIFDPPQQLFCTSYNNDIQEAELLQLNEITNEAILHFIKTWKHQKIWHLKVSFEQFLQLHLCQKAAEVVSEEAIKQAFGVSFPKWWYWSEWSANPHDGNNDCPEENHGHIENTS